MVPSLFLDVKPDHRILDMCAAPGSKTFQLLEVIHKEDQPGVLSKGMVIANDLNVQRCHLLIHQTKRMCSPNILVTNHEAQHFPGLKKKIGVDAKDSDGVVGDDTGLMFDRVLCDVPCSGDGTLRKAPDLWKKWSPGMGNGLHCLQIQIAMRGVQLLEVGGRMVYSTCSLNPIEDEAVVAEILRQSGGCMELIDVSSELPELKRRPGLKSWKVKGKRRWFASYHEDKFRTVLPSMFPSGKRLAEIPRESMESTPDSSADAAEGEAEVSEFPLERCIRILPHEQDTGGFFIAAFRKVGQYKRVSNSSQGKKSRYRRKLQQDADEDAGNDAENLEKVAEADRDADAADDNAQPIETEIENPKADTSKPQKQGPWHGVDPVLFLEDEQIIRSLASYYGIQESLPLSGHLVVRSDDTSRVKRIYYVSKSVSDVARLNFQTGQMLKITSAGLKIFERHSNREDASACAFRIASEGLPLLLPHLTKQLLYATKDDFKLLLSPTAVPFVAFKDPEFTSAMQSLVVGCCVVVLKDSVGTNDVTAVGCWRGRTNMSLLVPRVEADQMLKRLFPDEADRTSKPGSLGNEELGSEAVEDGTRDQETEEQEEEQQGADEIEIDAKESEKETGGNEKVAEATSTDSVEEKM